MAQYGVFAVCSLLSYLLNILFVPFAVANGGESPALGRDIEKATNQSLLWGPYRPNLYFGIRPRIPKSLLMGLLWVRVNDAGSVQHNFRHTCEQHELDGYGWDEYDVRTGGRQTIHDPKNQLDLHIDFVKIPGGDHGGNWGVRIKGIPREDAIDLKTTVIFYAALEGLGTLELANEKDTLGLQGPVTLQGQTLDLGEFEVEITRGPKSNTAPRHDHPSWDEKPLDRTLVHSYQLPEDALWQTKAILFEDIKNSIDALIKEHGQENPIPPEQLFTISNEMGNGNLHFVQKVFEGGFEFDVLFSSGSSPKRMSSEDVTRAGRSGIEAFSKRFSKVFKPQAPFDHGRYEKFSKSLFSNLLGGIGYFSGDSRVDRSYAPEYEEENEGFWEETAEARAKVQPQSEGPSELFTSIPSRPFFPRGFLWDEGFHLLPIVDWDTDLTLDIIKSWFKLIDDDGWIGREQILGPEARSKVPLEFQVQYPHYANPPTLFYVLLSFLDKLDAQAHDSAQQNDVNGNYIRYLSNKDAALQYLRDIYPLLKRHYYWFRKTQAGDIKSYDRNPSSSKEAYRWRGRTQQHLLTSGLDDYPRPQPPHPGELHVDLISWVGLMSRVLKRIANTLGQTDDATEFSEHELAILQNIDDLHWSDKNKVFCDATIDDYEESVHICHRGYVSLFPFLVGLLPNDSPRLGSLLDLIADPEELWSDYGIRSLSKKDENYGQGENYWRGPIWMNMNYLAVARLLELAQSTGPYQKRAVTLYSQLRHNMVETVYNSWEKTGFAWEQYNPETGAGQRTQHFTGWTSLVVKVMGMPDLDSDKAGTKDEL